MSPSLMYWLFFILISLKKCQIESTPRHSSLRHKHKHETDGILYRSKFYSTKNRALSDRKLAKIGSRYYNDGNFKKAIEFYDKAIEMNSSRVEYYRGRGNCHWALRNYAKTIDDLRVVLQKAPNDQKSRSLLSYALLENGDVEDAVKNMLTLESSEIFEFAKTLVFKNKITEAIRCYNTMIERGPELLLYYEGRGNCYLQIGEFDNAIKDFETALSKERDEDKFFRLLVAEAKFVAGRIEEAKEEMTHLDEFRLSVLAQNLIKWEKYGEAVVCYTEIIDRDPSEVSVWCKRARCYQEAGKLEDAISDYKKCSLVPFEQQENKLKLGELLLKTGQYEDAKNVLNTIDEGGLQKPDRRRLREALRMAVQQDQISRIHIEQPVMAPSVMVNG